MGNRPFLPHLLTDHYLQTLSNYVLTIMFKTAFTLTGCLFFLLFTISAQTNDPVLFTVKGTPVLASEFRYIYAKTNQDKADFSEQSLRDYLDLYIKFKLKVQKAREMRLDTVEATKAELEGYRRQLANSYLVDKEVTDKLIRETYERSKQDVDISHILIACDRNAKAVDTLKAYNRAKMLLNKIQAGADFEKMAVDSSQDKSVVENRGNLGFVNAMLPDGYYPMEVAIYAAKPGSIIGPIRSYSGYHLVRVNGFRPARGEMEISHILLRKDPNNPAKNAAVKTRIDSIYNAMDAQGGTINWDDFCARFSEDKGTSPKGGYLGFFGINHYQKAFEDAAFALKNNGDMSKPVETSIGWHIIKRNSARPVAAFEIAKRPLSDRIKRDSRNEIAKQSMISRIQREGGMTANKDLFEKWAAKQVDTSFLTFRWKTDPARPQDALISYKNGKTYSLADFEDYCLRNNRERQRGGGNPIRETIDKLYKGWADEVAMQFEESQLETKYPDFKSLMREYEEGILLFEALKINVWDRANTDTTGLEAYFTKNLKDKYKWEERLKSVIYTVKTDDPKTLLKVREYASKKPMDAVLKKFNKKTEVVSAMERSHEKGKVKDFPEPWKVGYLTDAKIDAGTKTATFQKIEAILPPTSKTLAEARGYAVADYQDFLEKEWIEQLRKDYPVKIEESALKTLIKK